MHSKTLALASRQPTPPLFRFVPLALILASAFPAQADVVLPEVEVRSTAADDPANPKVRSVSTATKTSTPPKYVPQSIDSVSVERALDYGQNTMAAALSGVAGVNNASDTRFDNFVIRGFTSSADLFLDGIRDDAQYVRDLSNVERIEVLKGPGAVLYGRGSGGGVINRISKQPKDESFGKVNLRAGSYGVRGASVDLNRVINEEWSARLNLNEESADSFRQFVSSNKRLVAPSIRWDNRQGSSWVLQYENAQNERTPDRGISSIRTGVTGAFQYALPTSIDRSTTYGNPARDFLRDETQSLRSTFNYALNEAWSLRHVLGIIKLDNQFENTYATSGVLNTGTGVVNVSRTRFTQDLQHNNMLNTFEVTGRGNWGGFKHQLLMGVELGEQERNVTLMSSTASSVTLSNPNLVTTNGALTVSSRNQHKVSSRGIYVQNQIDVTDTWKLLAGVRQDNFEIDSTNLLNNRREVRKVNALSPRVGVVWSPVAAHSFYGSYTKNFTPAGGGLIGITPGASGNDLSPEFSRQYETGVKSDWLGGALSTTLAAYQLELYNRRTTDPNDATRIILTGLQRSQGVEASVAGKLVSSWYLRGSMAVQSARVLEAEAQYIGKRPTNTSRINGSVALSYAPKLGLYGEIGMTYVGARFADRDNLLALPGYTRMDALAGYRWRATELQVAVTNLTNRDYW